MVKICKENINELWPTETNQRILNYMEVIIEALEEKYHQNIPNRYILQLDLLRDLWKNYIKVSNELTKNDIYLKGEKGRIYQNPALDTQQRLYAKIMDCLKTLGVTVFEEKREKIMDKKLKAHSGKSSESTADNEDAANMAKMLLS